MNKTDRMKKSKSVEELDKLYKSIAKPTPDEIEAYEDLRVKLMASNSIDLTIKGSGFKFLIKNRREDLPEVNLFLNPNGKPIIPFEDTVYNIPKGSTYNIYYPKIVDNKIELQYVKKVRDMAEIAYDISTANRSSKSSTFGNKILTSPYMSGNLITMVDNYTVIRTNLITEMNLVEWTVITYWQKVGNKIEQVEFEFVTD